MTALADFVALSLLPSSCWRHAATFLKAGDAPPLVLERVAQAIGRAPIADRSGSLAGR
jgi:hypothetical protein